MAAVTEFQLFPATHGHCETMTCRGKKADFRLGRPDCPPSDHRNICADCAHELVKNVFLVGMDTDDHQEVIAVVEKVRQELVEQSEEYKAILEAHEAEIDKVEQVELDNTEVFRHLERDELYEYAKEYDINGRSKMDKEELIQALLHYAEENDIHFQLEDEEE